MTFVDVAFGEVAVVAENHEFIPAEGDGIGKAEAFAGAGGDFAFGIRFVEGLAVDEDFAVDDLEGLAGDSDDAFEEEDLTAGVFDSDDIAALRFAFHVGEFVDEFDLAIAVGGEHGIAGDANGDEDEFEEDDGDEDEEEDASDGPGGITPENKTQQGRRLRLVARCLHLHMSRGLAGMGKKAS